MTETKYNVEVKFKTLDRWEYIAQASTLQSALKIASRHYDHTNETNNAREFRIREVVKTIVWQNGKRVHHGNKTTTKRSSKTLS